MKFNPFILIIVIILGVYIGLHTNYKQVTNLVRNDTEGINSTNKQKNNKIKTVELSKEEQQKKFMDFYNKIHEFITTFDKIDKNVASLSNNSPSKLQAYEYFKKLEDSMDKGEKIPL